MNSTLTTARLGNLTRIRTGKLDANANDPEGAYPFFTCARESLRIATFSYDTECVLVAGNGDLNVKYFKGKFDAYQRTYIIESLDRNILDVRYLSRFMDQYLETLRQLSIGGVIKYIKLGNLSDAEIPLPPLPEQRRIAAILDKADALRAKRREALAHLDSLAQSIFLEMFGEQTASASKYPAAKLVSVAELINGDRSGNYPSGDDLVGSGILFLSTKNIRDGEMDLSECNFIMQKKFDSLTRGKLKRNDLVITLRGTLGQCAIYDCIYDTGFINAQMMIIRPSEQIAPQYLRSFIAQPNTQARLIQNSSGSAVPQLTAAQIGELVVPLPPMMIQKEFARRLLSVEKLKTPYRASLVDMNALFASLQHHAFQGEL